MNFTYREICKGVQDRGNLYCMDYHDICQIDGTDQFYGQFGYSSNSLDSSRIIDHLVIDFDNIEISKVVENIKVLDDSNVEFLIYFSGNKGFHIVVPNIWKFTEKELMNKTLKITMKKYFPDCNESIYHGRSLIRIPNTIHGKTGKPKALIDKQMFLYEYKMFYEYGSLRPLFENLPSYSGKPFKKYYAIHKELQTVTTVKGLPSPKCIHSILRNLPVKGERHIAAMRLISHLVHYNYMPIQSVIAIIKDWWQQGEMSAKNEEWIERTVPEVFDKYRYGCNDSYLKNRCSQYCKFYKGKGYMSTPKTVADIYKSYREKIDKGLYYDLSSIYNMIPNRFMIYANDLVGIIGAPGVGKSTLAMDIVLRLLEKRPNDFVVWSNLDNSDDLLVRRMIQHKARLTEDEIFKPSSSTIDKIDEAVKNIEGRISIESVSNIDVIDKYMEDPEQHWPKKPSAWVIDHVGNLTTKSSGYDRMRELGEKTKKFAKDHDILTIAIGHITKSDGRMGTMNIHSVRDANIGEAADVLLGMSSKPTESNKSLVTIKTLKARDNDKLSFDMYYNPTYYKFETIF